MKDAQERREDWHMDKKIIGGLIGAVVLNITVSAWQGFFILKTLDTDPPIIERIIKLEYQVSEQGRVNQLILDELRAAKKERKEATKERVEFRKEQTVRTTTVHDSADHMKNRRIHRGQ